MIRSYIHSPAPHPLGAAVWVSEVAGGEGGRGGGHHCRPQGAERFVFSVDITARQSETELPALVSRPASIFGLKNIT